MLLEIIIAVVFSQFLGFTWYGPLFGKQWLKILKVTPKQVAAAKKKGMPASMYAWMFVSSIITSLVLYAYTPSTAWAAVQTASTLWLGFVGAIMLHGVIFEKKPWKLYLINVSYYLVNMIVLALLFAAFK